MCLCVVCASPFMWLCCPVWRVCVLAGEMLKRVLAMATTAALVGAAVGKEVAWRA